MNRGELRASIDRHTGIGYDTGALNDLIDEAVQFIAIEADWPWLELVHDATLVADTDPTLPDGVRTITAVTLAGLEVPAITAIEADTWTASGNTRYRGFYQEGTTLRLNPAPTGGEALKVRYVADEPLLSDDASTPLLPAVHHPALVALASARVLDRAAPARAAAEQAFYDRWVARMRRTAGHRTRTGRIRVRAGGGL